MALTQNILVATDFSQASELALDAAAILAKQFAAKVTIVHVYDPAPLAPIATRGAGMAQLGVEREVEERIHAELGRLRETRFADVPTAKTALVLSANPADAICNY